MSEHNNSIKYTLKDSQRYIIICEDEHDVAKFDKLVIETFPARDDVWIAGHHEVWFSDRVARYFECRNPIRNQKSSATLVVKVMTTLTMKITLDLVGYITEHGHLQLFLPLLR